MLREWQPKWVLLHLFLKKAPRSRYVCPLVVNEPKKKIGASYSPNVSPEISLAEITTSPLYIALHSKLNTYRPTQNHIVFSLSTQGNLFPPHTLPNNCCQPVSFPFQFRHRWVPFQIGIIVGCCVLLLQSHYSTNFNNILTAESSICTFMPGT